MHPLVCAFPFPHREAALQPRHTQFLSTGMTKTLGYITAVFSFPKSNLENKALSGLGVLQHPHERPPYHEGGLRLNACSQIWHIS